MNTFPPMYYIPVTPELEELNWAHICKFDPPSTCVDPSTSTISPNDSTTAPISQATSHKKPRRRETPSTPHKTKKVRKVARVSPSKTRRSSPQPNPQNSQPQLPPMLFLPIPSDDSTTLDFVNILFAPLHSTYSSQQASTTSTASSHTAGGNDLVALPTSANTNNSALQSSPNGGQMGPKCAAPVKPTFPLAIPSLHAHRSAAPTSRDFTLDKQFTPSKHRSKRHIRRVSQKFQRQLQQNQMQQKVTLIPAQLDQPSSSNPSTRVSFQDHAQVYWYPPSSSTFKFDKDAKDTQLPVHNRVSSTFADEPRPAVPSDVAHTEGSNDDDGIPYANKASVKSQANDDILSQLTDSLCPPSTQQHCAQYSPLNNKTNQHGLNSMKNNYAVNNLDDSLIELKNDNDTTSVYLSASNYSINNPSNVSQGGSYNSLPYIPIPLNSQPSHIFHSNNSSALNTQQFIIQTQPSPESPPDSIHETGTLTASTKSISTKSNTSSKSTPLNPFHVLRHASTDLGNPIHAFQAITNDCYQHALQLPPLFDTLSFLSANSNHSQEVQSISTPSSSPCLSTCDNFDNLSTTSTLLSQPLTAPALQPYFHSPASKKAKNPVVQHTTSWYTPPLHPHPTTQRQLNAIPLAMLAPAQSSQSSPTLFPSLSTISTDQFDLDVATPTTQQTVQTVPTVLSINSNNIATTPTTPASTRGVQVRQTRSLSNQLTSTITTLTAAAVSTTVTIKSSAAPFLFNNKTTTHSPVQMQFSINMDEDQKYDSSLLNQQQQQQHQHQQQPLVLPELHLLDMLKPMPTTFHEQTNLLQAPTMTISRGIADEQSIQLISSSYDPIDSTDNDTATDCTSRNIIRPVLSGDCYAFSRNAVLSIEKAYHDVSSNMIVKIAILITILFALIITVAPIFGVTSQTPKAIETTPHIPPTATEDLSKSTATMSSAFESQTFTYPRLVTEDDAILPFFGQIDGTNVVCYATSEQTPFDLINAIMKPQLTNNPSLPVIAAGSGKLSIKLPTQDKQLVQTNQQASPLIQDPPTDLGTGGHPSSLVQHQFISSSIEFSEELNRPVRKSTILTTLIEPLSDAELEPAKPALKSSRFAHITPFSADSSPSVSSLADAQCAMQSVQPVSPQQQQQQQQQQSQWLTQSNHNRDWQSNTPYQRTYQAPPLSVQKLPPPPLPATAATATAPSSGSLDQVQNRSKFDQVNMPNGASMYILSDQQAASLQTQINHNRDRFQQTSRQIDPHFPQTSSFFAKSSDLSPSVTYCASIPIARTQQQQQQQLQSNTPSQTTRAQITMTQSKPIGHQSLARISRVIQVKQQHLEQLSLLKQHQSQFATISSFFSTTHTSSQPQLPQQDDHYYNDSLDQNAFGFVIGQSGLHDNFCRARDRQDDNDNLSNPRQFQQFAPLTADTSVSKMTRPFQSQLRLRASIRPTPTSNALSVQLQEFQRYSSIMFALMRTHFFSLLQSQFQIFHNKFSFE